MSVENVRDNPKIQRLSLCNTVCKTRADAVDEAANDAAGPGNPPSSAPPAQEIHSPSTEGSAKPEEAPIGLAPATDDIGAAQQRQIRLFVTGLTKMEQLTLIESLAGKFPGEIICSDAGGIVEQGLLEGFEAEVFLVAQESTAVVDGWFRLEPPPEKLNGATYYFSRAEIELFNKYSLLLEKMAAVLTPDEPAPAVAAAPPTPPTQTTAKAAAATKSKAVQPRRSVPPKAGR